MARARHLAAPESPLRSVDAPLNPRGCAECVPLELFLIEPLSSQSARAVRFLPSLAHSPVIRSYAGLRPWSPDHLPLIGPVAAVPGLLLATGHEGAGIGLAPISGRLIADYAVGAELPPFAATIQPDRFPLVGGTPG